MKYFWRSLRSLAFAVAIWLLEIQNSAGAAAGESSRYVRLADDWKIQSSAAAGVDGRAVSSTTFDAKQWHSCAAPSTVLGALVKAGVYTNIFFGKNITNVPTAPFTNAWWYRKEFKISAEQAAECADLIFEGINYRANVWLNGERIASADDVFGAFRTFSLNVGGHLRGGENVLAVEVFPPKPGDFTMGFVDWNPKPPDKNMGLFRPVKLHFFDQVAVKNVFVQSKIDHAGWRDADLTIQADLENRSTKAAEALVAGRVNGQSFSEKFALGAGETRTVSLRPGDHPELRIKSAKLWWPWELGEPALNDLDLTTAVDGRLTDQAEVRFGIREVADYINPDGYRGYIVNGKKILIRGGGWADDLLLNEDRDNLRAQIQYTKAMNLNTIRLEGVWGSSQRLYDLADENGLLIMVGWSCQWEWPENLGKKTDPHYGGFLTEPDMWLATNYLHDQVFWLRNHPSIYVWVLGSDMLPSPTLEKRYDALLPQLDPTRPALKSCGSVTSKVSGPSAVKMNGPYDYVTPNYWYEDKENGGAFGYNTETGPGPQPPPLESLERMLPPDHLWPIDDEWSFHCARGEFRNLDRYLNAFNHRFGPATNAADFAFKSQAANYEAMRAMYEAFAANLPHTTGIIQWMLNASWPKMYWQLYDYYLVPGGAFYGAKKGAAPAAVIYNYGDHGVYAVNQSPAPWADYQTAVTVYDLNSRKLLEKTVTNAVAAGGSQKVFELGKLASPTAVYFVELHGLDPATPSSAADNFYWLSVKPDELDEGKTKWFVTPNKSFADFTSLSNLPAATVKCKVSYHSSKAGRIAEVTLTNTGDTLAFFIELKVVGAKSGQILTPVFWDDNYISIPPHGERKLHAVFPYSESPRLKLQGWNVTFD